MDDLSQKLSGILNDPDSMEQVRKMAESLFSGEKEPENKGNSGGMPSPDELQAIISVVSQLNSQQDSERTHLINALKPYLSEQRQAKADNAIKILKLLELWPAIKDSGLFKF